MVLRLLKSAGIRFLTTMASASKPTAGPIPQAASQSLFRKIPIEVGREHGRPQARLKSQLVEGGQAIDNPTIPPKDWRFRDVFELCLGPMAILVGGYLMVEARASFVELLKEGPGNGRDQLKAFTNSIAALAKDREMYHLSLDKVAAGTQEYSTDEGRDSEVPSADGTGGIMLK